MANPSAPGLWMAEGLTLPVDVLTETLLIIAKRGSGKTYSASVLVEEMVGAGLPVCVIDPLGVWWGLRSSADGEGPGLPVTIIGGEHADLPLPADGGAMVADLVIEEHVPVVLDLSELSKTKQRAFVCAFLERLYHRNREPLHIVIDEADLFAPMRATGEIARLLGAYEDIVRRGRARGLGCTSITQRPAVLHTDIRSQAEVLIALRLIGTHDVAAIDEWVRLHATDEEAREVKASLPSLPVGTAWVWSPGWLELLVKVKIRARLTFDSSATPKVGQRVIMPREFARVDPAELERMAARLTPVPLPEPPARAARSAEVSRLTQRVRELEAALAEARQRPAERVEVPAVSPGDMAALDQACTAMREAADRVELALRSAPKASPPVLAPARTPVRVPAAPAPALRPVPPAPDGEPPAALSKAQRAILAVLAQFPAGRTRTQLGLLAGYSVKSSGFANALGALRSAGLVNRGDPIQITPEGIAAAGSDWEPLPAGDALAGHWMRQLGKAERAILTYLLGIWPAGVSRDELAAGTGYSAASSGFANALGKLRSLELINRGPLIAADETFAQEVGRG